MTALTWLILAYVALQLAIGLWVARRVRSEDDFLVAGRRLGVFSVGASVFATWFGAETCVSAAGQVRGEGLTPLTAVEPFGFGLCLVLGGAFLAAPLWRRRITTIADLLRQRYGPTAERLAALVTIPTSILWAAAQIRAFGEVLAVGTELSVTSAVTVAAVIAIVYTSLGGLLADVVTDVLQGAVLVLGLIVLLCFVAADAGGAPQLGERVAGALEAGRASEADWLELLETWSLVVLGSLIAQEIVARTVAARSESAARRGALLGSGLYLVVGAIPVVLALGASQGLGTGGTDDAFLPALAQAHLPPMLFVVFAGALVSAILSTVDSALLAAAAIGARNLLPARLGSEAARLRAARAGVVVCGLFAWALAFGAESVFALIEESSGFASAGVVTVTVLALATPWGGAWAGSAALVGGAASWCVCAYALPDFPAPFLASLMTAVAAFALGAVLDGRRVPSAPRAGGAP